MSFKENLLKKIEINKLSRKVLQTIGPADSGLKIDKEAMRNLLEIGPYQYKKERDLDLYIEQADDGPSIILVLDNSNSMQMRDAVEPLKTAVEELLKIFRPIDRVWLVVFDKNNTMSVAGRELNVNILQSSDTDEMRRFLDQSYDGKHITYETWLFEAMPPRVEKARR